MYYFIGIVTFIGLLLPLVLHFKLKGLIHAAEHPGKSEHPLIKVMLNKFTACYKVKVGVNNVDNFVDKYVYTYKIGGFYLFTWDKICGQPAWILLYGCFIQLIVDYFYFGGKETDLSTIGIGVAASGLLMLYNHLFDRMDKLRVFGKEMADYLENSLGAKLEQEYNNPDRLRGSFRSRAAEGSGESGQIGQQTGSKEDAQTDSRAEPGQAVYASTEDSPEKEKHAKRKVSRFGQKKRGQQQQEGVLATLSDQEMEALLGELAASVSGRGGLGKDQEIIDEILKEYLS